MKISTELALKQSLSMTTDMKLAINLLGMDAQEIDQLIAEELNNNPLLEIKQNHADGQYCSTSPYEIALEKPLLERDIRAHLLQQVREEKFNKIEQAIAEHLIHNMDDDGFLVDIDNIFLQIIDDLSVFVEWIEFVRQKIMSLEPIGCCAKDSKEALYYQIKNLKLFDDKKAQLLCDSLTLKTYKSLKNINPEERQILKTLRPRPALVYQSISRYDNEAAADLMVIVDKNKVFVSLLKRPSQHLIVRSKNYYGSLSKDDRAFLSKRFKRATFLVEALRFREHNLLRVAQAIVEQQRTWFLGLGDLLPLTLRHIAELNNLHQSTISRLSRGKYLLCHKGMFELKYFFSSSISKNNSEQYLSSKTVKECIKSLIGKEDKNYPFSDRQIGEQLQALDMVISRRTITKYREDLRIPKASDRKSLG